MIYGSQNIGAHIGRARSAEGHISVAQRHEAAVRQGSEAHREYIESGRLMIGKVMDMLMGVQVDAGDHFINDQAASKGQVNQSRRLIAESIHGAPTLMAADQELAASEGKMDNATTAVNRIDGALNKCIEALAIVRNELLPDVSNAYEQVAEDSQETNSHLEQAKEHIDEWVAYQGQGLT